MRQTPSPRLSHKLQSRKSNKISQKASFSASAEASNLADYKLTLIGSDRLRRRKSSIATTWPPNQSKIDVIQPSSAC